MNMSKHTKAPEHRTTSPDPAHRERRTVPEFKPVELPALKAAMRAVRKQPVRPPRHELPPFLRKDNERG
jgi:hypothetical protein